MMITLFFTTLNAQMLKFLFKAVVVSHSIIMIDNAIAYTTNVDIESNSRHAFLF